LQVRRKRKKTKNKHQRVRGVSLLQKSTLAKPIIEGRKKEEREGAGIHYRREGSEGSRGAYSVDRRNREKRSEKKKR